MNNANYRKTPSSATHLSTEDHHFIPYLSFPSSLFVIPRLEINSDSRNNKRANGSFVSNRVLTGSTHATLACSTHTQSTTSPSG